MLTMGRLLLWLCVVSLFAYGSGNYVPPKPHVEALPNGGIRFTFIESDPRVQLLAVHYSINKPEKSNIWNFDINQRQAGNRWVHENKRRVIKPGDVVNYWTYGLKDGRGYPVFGFSWKVPGNGVQQTTRPPTTPPRTSRATSRAPVWTVATKPVTLVPGGNKESGFRPGAACPDKAAGLTPFSGSGNVVIGRGQKYKLSRSVTLETLSIQDGGLLVVEDTGRDIELRARSIFIRGGEFHVGSETCRYQGHFTITLLGRSTEGRDHPLFGKKYLGVSGGGTLELHGQKKLSWTMLNAHVAQGAVDPILNLQDDISSWHVGDWIVLSSTDFDMNQAEQFQIQQCSTCNNHQLKIKGRVAWQHWGEVSDGVDMRGEVGLLTRNIVIRGDTAPSCYGANWCQYFKEDTFGGHFMVTSGFTAVHVEGVEFTKMGQQLEGRYPVHFHMSGDVDTVGGYSKGTYVKDLAIHHVFHRCVTIHGTSGLLVKDTVSYETYGHCYFLEDGAERRNVLNHNLGLNTRPSTVLPSDRNNKMCKEIRHNICCGFVPDINNCNAVTTFWITHPDNVIINNVAGGSEKAGFWYIFKLEPSGLSKGKLPRFHSSNTPIAEFRNNRAHSNRRIALNIDAGTKIEKSNNQDRREFGAMGGGLYAPHKDSKFNGEPAVALIDGLVAFKNNDGVWVRGGEIHLTNCQFADNVFSLTMASGGEYPYDTGTHQQVTDSVFVGESRNRGNKSPGNTFWGVDSEEHYRTMPHYDSHPLFGVRIYDGPVRVQRCKFVRYFPSSKRKIAALGFFLHNPFFESPFNELTQLSYDSKSVRVSVTAKGNWFGEANADGDKTAIVHDLDGSTTGMGDSYVFRPDNHLVQTHGGCRDVAQWNARICRGNVHKNAQFYIRAGGTSGIKLYRDEFSSSPLQLRGLGAHYMPVVMKQKSYTVHWPAGYPRQVELTNIMFDKGNWVRVGLCLPGAARFNVYSKLHRHGDTHQRQFRSVDSLQLVDSSDGTAYYYDRSSGLLFLKPTSHYDRSYWSFCAKLGCERIHVEVTGGGGSADCSSRAYPRYAQG